MKVFMIILFLFLIVCAIAVSFSNNLLNSILVYMSFSLIMSVIWMCLKSPDLAITEAAVGAGVTTLLFFGCFKRIKAIDVERDPAGSANDPDGKGLLESDVNDEGKEEEGYL
ncbi:MAG: DUF4040 domain-containing protein [Lachnospiraceae bacterium]|nr:DUF4040 domain-containing protein [Lachnospiraceae bacterium]